MKGLTVKEILERITNDNLWVLVVDEESRKVLTLYNGRDSIDEIYHNEIVTNVTVTKNEVVLDIDIKPFTERLVEEVIEEDLVGLGLERGEKSMLYERSDYSGRDFYDLIPFEFITEDEQEHVIDRIIDGVIERLDEKIAPLRIDEIIRYIAENVDEVVIDKMYW